MTREEAIEYIKRGCAWRQDGDDEIVAMMDIVQHDELETGQSLPWFLLTEAGTLAGTGGSDTLTLPTGFIRPAEKYAVWTVDDDGKKVWLNRMEKALMTQYYQSYDAGTAMAYALGNTQLFVAPVPSADFTIYMSYWAHDTPVSELAASETNEWLTEAPSVLINLAGVRIADDYEMETSSAKFAKRFAAANSRLIAEMALRETQDMEYTMGEFS